MSTRTQPALPGGVMLRSHTDFKVKPLYRKFGRKRSTKELPDDVRCNSAPNKVEAHRRFASRHGNPTESNTASTMQITKEQDADDVVCQQPIRKRESFLNLSQFDLDYKYDSSDDESLKTADGAANNGRSVYDSCCERLGIVPVQAFRRKIPQQYIDLRHQQLTVADIKAISVALLRNVTIQEVDLSGNIIGSRGAGYIAEILNETVYITELNISETKPGLEGLQVLASAVRNCRSLRKLDISGNNFDASHCPVLADIISNNEYIHELNLAYNEIGVDGGKIVGPAIADNVALTKLSLRWNHLRLAGAEAICNGITNNSQLRSLDLSWNGLAKHGCRALAKALETNQHLVELNLESNRIDASNLEILMNGVTNNQSLRYLNLSKNPFMSHGATVLLTTLQKSPDCGLNDIDLGDTAVDPSFLNLLATLRETRELRMRHGQCVRTSSSLSVRPSSERTPFEKYDPLLVLFEYMKQDNMRLVDLFHSFDLDKSSTLSRDEIEKGFMTVNIPMTEDRLDELLWNLDMNCDGNIDLRELAVGQKKTRRKVTSVKKDKRELQRSDSEPFAELKIMIKSALDEKHKNLQKNGRGLKTSHEEDANTNVVNGEIPTALREREALAYTNNQESRDTLVNGKTDEFGCEVDGSEVTVPEYPQARSLKNLETVTGVVKNVYRFKRGAQRQRNSAGNDDADKINEEILRKYRSSFRRFSQLRCVFKQEKDDQGVSIEGLTFVDD